jgi:hypothetical protein
MPGSDFIFRGQARDGVRAAQQMERALRDLRRETAQGQASLGSLGASHRVLGRDQDQLTLRMGRLTNAMGNFNVQARFMQNMIGLLKFPAMITAVGLATQAISTLTAGVVALAGALGPLSGLLAAYPALLGAVAQGAVVGKVAFKDMSEAIGGNEEALKRLTPEARKFAQTFRQEVRPALKDVQRDIQSELFPSLTRALQTLTRSPLRGVVRRAGVQTAGVLGQAAEGFAQSLTQPRQVRQIEQFLQGNTRMLRQLTTALLPATRGMLELMNAAQPLTRWLGNLAIEGARWFEQTVRANKQSGDLERFFGRTRQTLELIGPLLRDFGGALYNIMRLGAPLGRTILRDLGEAAGEFRDWTESAKGRNAIVEWFRAAKDPLYEMGRLVRDIGQAFFRLGSGQNFAPLLRQIRTELLPVLETMVATTTQAFGPALVTLLTELGRLFGSLAGASGPLVLFTETLSKIVGAFADLLQQHPQLQSMFITLTGAFAVMKAVSFASAITGLTRLIGLMASFTRATQTAAGAQAGLAAAAAITPGAAGRGRAGAALTGFGATAAAVSPLAGGLGGAAGSAGRLAGILGRVAGFAGPIGILGGTIGALAASFLLTRNRASGASQKVGDLEQATRELASATRDLKQASEEDEDATLRLEGANLAVERALKTRNQVVREAVRMAKEQAAAEDKTLTRAQIRRIREATTETLAYREASHGVRQAKEEQADAEKAAAGTGRTVTEQTERQRRAEVNLRATMERTTREFRTDRVNAMERARKAAQQQFLPVAAQVRAAEEAGQRVTKRYREEMDELAERARKEHSPRMQRFAEAALQVSRRIKGIPTKRQIDVQMRVNASLEAFAVNIKAPGETGVRVETGDVRAGEFIEAQLNAGMTNAMGAYFREKEGDIMAGLRKAMPFKPVANVTPGLWDELGLASAYGLTLTSSYRPGATVAGSGRPSLHGYFPSRAIDVAGSASSMRSYAAAVLGRPGLTEVLYSGYGPTTSSNPITRADHYDHVHVGAAYGDVRAGQPAGQDPDEPSRESRLERRQNRLERAIERLRNSLERTRERLSAAMDKMTERALRVFDALTERAAARTPAARALAAMDEAAKQQRLADIQRRMASPLGATRREAEAEMREFLTEQQRENLERQAEEERRQLEVRREERRLVLEGRIARLQGRISRGGLRGRAARTQLRRLLAEFGITPAVGGEVIGEAFQRPFAASIAAIGPIASDLRGVTKDLAEATKDLREVTKKLRDLQKKQVGGVVGGVDKGFDSELILARPGEIVLNAAQQQNVASRIMGGGAGVVIHIEKPTFLTGDRSTARELARLIGPEIERAVILRT